MSFAVDWTAVIIAIFTGFIFIFLLQIKKQQTTSFLYHSHLLPITKTSWKMRFVKLPKLLKYLALVLILFAFIDPHLTNNKTAKPNNNQQKTKQSKIEKISCPTKGLAIYFVLDKSSSMKQEIKNIVEDYDNNIEAIKNKEKTQNTLTKLLAIPLKEEENKNSQITIEVLQNSITNNTSCNQVLTTNPKRASLLYQNAKQWLCRAINILNNKNSEQDILQKSIAEQIYSQKTTERALTLPNQQNYTPIATMLTNNQKWVIREAMPFVNALTKIEKKLRKDVMHLYNLGKEKAILAKDLIQKNKLLSAKVQQEVATKHWEKALALLKNQHEPYKNEQIKQTNKKKREKKLLKLMQELQEMEKEDNPKKNPTIIQNNKKTW